MPSKPERLTSVVANKAAPDGGYLVMNCFSQRASRSFFFNLFVRVLARMRRCAWILGLEAGFVVAL